MRSGQVAAAAGVNLQTLRYYERRGLLPAPDRTLGGHRAYPAETVTRLRTIKVAQRLGFTLTEIGDLLAAGEHPHRRRTSGPGRSGRSGRSVEAGLQAQAAAKLADVEERIAELTVIAETLRSAITVGCDDLAECATTANCPLPFAELGR
ncbi:helix-turn-helix domain-containing protein [Kribbella sancticallisti]|uniref:Helix-turn-helix domain-containing protein n=1 Tax=Kribbella sancticallisti TaxID=460087 RepID=A0ABP4Q5V4_9ACTN